MKNTDNISEQSYIDVQIWLYDVWGNEKDGYEVNDQWKHEEPITMDMETWETPELLKKVLKKYILKPGIHMKSIDFPIFDEDYTEFEVHGRPIGRMEIVKRY